MTDISGTSGPFLSVIIPAFNEQLRLSRTIEAARTYLDRQTFAWEIAVVDDGSTDQTAQIVEDAAKADARVGLLRYAANRGKGFAVRYGMMNTSGRYRLFMDADNSTTIDQVADFLPILESGIDIVIGSRAVPGSEVLVHQARWKEWLGVLGNRWIQFWGVPGIKDTQAGFKIFTAEAAQDIFPLLKIDGWAFDVEVLAVARTLGYQIAELPIRWRNDPDSRVTATTYFQVLRDVCRVRRSLRKGIYQDSQRRTGSNA